MAATVNRSLLVSMPFVPVSREQLRTLRDLLAHSDQTLAGSSFQYFQQYGSVYQPLQAHLLGLLAVRPGDPDASLHYADKLERMDVPAEVGTVVDDFAQHLRARAAWMEARPDDALAELELARMDITMSREQSALYALGFLRYVRGEILREL